MSALVRAGGGIVLDDAGRVLVVHRHRYDDWSWPKGKAEHGEPILACALREVAEETGLAVRAVAPIAVVRYELTSGHTKVVTWFLLRPDGNLQPQVDGDEVDDAVWLAPSLAAERLSYASDVGLLARLAVPVLALKPPSSPG